MTRLSLTVALAVSVSVIGCVARRVPPPPAHTNIPPLTEAKRVEEPPPQPVTPPIDAALLPADSPDVQAAMQQFLTIGKAPLIEKKSAGFIQYPFGLSQPTVYCQPLQLCDIELEPGEEVIDLAAGDQERWVLQPLRSGPATHRTIHVMVKPTDDTRDMETAIVIGTNRRVYRVRLLSRRKGYIVNARFYYPQDLVQRFNTQQTENHVAAQTVAATLPPVSLENLDDRYHVEGDTTWRPTWVANDGTHTYLKMPADLRTSDAPALFVQTPGGDTALCNYRVKGAYYVVDKVFDRAVLTWGVGNDRQTVTIMRTAR
jgi:type IV secretion system protein TrbG